MAMAAARPSRLGAFREGLSRGVGEKEPRLSKRGYATNWLHLAGLWALGFAQPLFTILADSGDYLVARGNAWPDTPLVAFAIVVVPPTLLVGLEALLHRRPTLQRWLHASFVALLAAALVVQILKENFDPARRALTLAALVIGGCIGFLYLRTRFVPAMLGVLSLAAPAVLVWFLAFTPVASFAWPQSEDDPPAGATKPVPVVMVVLDEFSTASMMDGQQIEAGRFPNLARLSREATWFRNATTVADGTIHAVPAILTGHLNPDPEALPWTGDYPPSIFERLEGWDVNANEPATDFCHGCPGVKDSWPERSRQLVRDLARIQRRRLEPGKAPTEVVTPPETITERKETVRDWIANVRGGRTFNMLHIELPHFPWLYGPRGELHKERGGTVPGLELEKWTTDPRLVADGYRLYLDQAQFTDLLLGELVASLKRRGLWDRFLFILSADHGVAFTPGESRRNIVAGTAGQIAGVPMFLKAPGQSSGGPSDAAVQTIDLAPTVGDYLGADWDLEGHSLRAPVDRKTVRVWAGFGPEVTMPKSWYVRLLDQAAADLDKLETVE